MRPAAIKTLGYGISILSVLLLGVVSWHSAREQPLLFACLLGGIATSILGMFLRWLSYEVEKRKKAQSYSKAARIGQGPCTSSAQALAKRASEARAD